MFNMFTYHIEKLWLVKKIVEKLCGDIFALQQDNDRLKKEIAEAKKRKENLISDLHEAKNLAQLADTKVNNLAFFSRRNNLRIWVVLQCW